MNRYHVIESINKCTGLRWHGCVWATSHEQAKIEAARIYGPATYMTFDW